MLKIKSIGGISLSKDGSKAVFTVTSIEPEGESKVDFKYVSQVWTVNTGDNSSPKQLTTNKESSSQAAISPDGKKIVFTRTIDGKQQLFLLSLDGGEAVQLTKFKYGAAYATMEPGWQATPFFCLDPTKRSSEGFYLEPTKRIAGMVIGKTGI